MRLPIGASRAQQLELWFNILYIANQFERAGGDSRRKGPRRLVQTMFRSGEKRRKLEKSAPEKESMRIDPSGWRTRLDDDIIAHRRATGEWRDRTIADRLDEICRSDPDRRLVVDGVRAFSASAIRNTALRLCRLIAERGVKRGEVVSFQLPNWHEAILIDLACAYGGFVSNPIVPIYRDAEVSFIVANARSRLVFVPEIFRSFDYAAMTDRLRRQWPNLLDVIFVRPERASLPSFAAFMDRASDIATERPDPNDVKAIMYTSGTTGPAKGVLHTHNTLGAEIDNFAARLGLGATDVILMASPLTHITGYLYGLMLPITLGAPVILMDTWTAASAAALIERHNVTFTIGATPFLQELARHSRDYRRPFPSLRSFPTGGAPVPPEAIREANRSFANCVSFRIYGSTEAPTVTLGAPNPAHEELAATTEGFVVGHDAQLVGDDGLVVGDGEEGEIVTRGPEVSVGYADWSQNADAFDAEGFFHTGDLARRTPEGCLIITGRKKDLIIRGGENLSPKEIEDVLHTHPAIREAAVVAMPHQRLGETACAFVTLRNKADFRFDDMTALLQASGLAKQKYPERLEIVESLPYTIAGKVRKNVLRDEIRARIVNEQGAAERRPVRKTRVESARLTRQALLKAALRVVARYGYKKSSVSRITQAAGVAQGTLYSYFETHEQLLAELVPAEGANLVAALKRATENALDYFDYEARIFLAFAAYLSKSPNLLRVLTESEIAAPKSHAEYMRAIQELQLEALHRAQKTGEIRPQSDRAFRAIAEILAGARSHIAIGLGDRHGNRVFRHDQLPLWVADTYAKFVKNGLGGISPTSPDRRLAVPLRRTKAGGEADMRTHLLEASARLIYEVGFAGANVLAVTKAANVAIATFYAYFGSRQEFFEDLLTHVRRQMLAHVAEAVHGSDSFIDLERRGFEAFFDHVWRNPWYIRIETEAALWAPAAYLRHFHDLADRYIASMRRSRSRGELKAYEDHELPVLAFTMMAARHYLANRFVLDNPKAHRLPAWVGDAYMRFAAQGLSNDARQ
jgi:acyl-CoA synthetase (AMP-forming)/AMP-acid ligase II/AcrR family transcriptional regulator